MLEKFGKVEMKREVERVTYTEEEVKNTDISIGNIIGSNIFNIFAILGVTASVKKLDINVAFLDKDYLWMIGIALLLFLFLLPLRKGVVSRWKGVVLVAVYVVYIYFLF